MASNGISRHGDAAVAGLADRTTGLVGWTIAWRATSAVATLALGAFLIRQLSPSEYGRYTFVLSVLVYIALLATFGQDQGLLRYLPEVLGRGDFAGMAKLVGYAALVGLVALPVALVDALLKLQGNARVELAVGQLVGLLGVAIFLWQNALLVMATRRHYAISTERAVAAVIGPIGVGVVLVLALIILAVVLAVIGQQPA